MNLLLFSILLVGAVALYFFFSLFIRERDEKRKRIQLQKEFAERERAMQEALSLNRLRLEKQQAVQQATVQKEEHDKKVADAQQQAAILENQRQIAREYQAKRKSEAQLIEKQKLKLEKEKKNEEQKLAKQIQEQKEYDLLEERKQRDFCESGTDYCVGLENLYNKHPANFQFETIRRLSTNYGEPIMHQLNRGEAKLNTYEQLSQYIFAFGKMHQEKLRQSFESVFSNQHLDLNGQTVEIVDYGCGQGLGTVCFLDYVKKNVAKEWSVSKVILIEPSELALKRAALNVRYALRSIGHQEHVFAVHKGLDDINQLDISTCDKFIKIHILSNIIDVEDFDVNNLCQKIIETQGGVNLFVCVSPNIMTMQSRNRRLDLFQQHFVGRGEMTLISNRSSDIPNPRIGANPWRRYERIFKINLSAQLAPTSTINNSMVNFAEDDALPF